MTNKLIAYPCTFIPFIFSAPALASFSIDELKPAHIAEADMPDMVLLLDLIINGKASNKVVPVTYKAGDYLISSLYLTEVGIPVEFQQDLVAINRLPGVTVKYDSSDQKLFIDVPLNWLPKQNLANFNEGLTPLAEPSFGFLFNYLLYANKNNHSRPGLVSAYTEQRVFGRWGNLSNDGIYRRTFKDTRENRINDYIRYNTTWNYNDERRMVSYNLGDFVTGSLPWSNAVRLAGFQIARNFSTNPRLITYPLPQFIGQAAVPSTVDLYINSVKQSSLDVDPGSFTLDGLPYINGAGEAVIVTRDALGREIEIAESFYIDSNLLRKGLLDYNLSLGAIREQYGVKSFEYDDLAFSGVSRYGLTNYLTIEGRGEFTKRLAVLGAGITTRLGLLGVINGAYSRSYAKSDLIEDYANSNGSTDKDGYQASMGYTYQQKYFSVSTRRILYSKGFRDLANYKFSTQSRRRLDQVVGSLSLGRAGSLSTGYFDIRYFREAPERLLNVSYSLPLFHSMSLHASMNKQLGDNTYNGSVGLFIPMSNGQSASISSMRDRNKDYSQRVSYDKVVPTDGGLGYGFAFASKNGDEKVYREANVTWRTQHFQTRAGFQGRNNVNYFGELSGSLVAMDGTVLAANKIDDSFVVVSTDGVGDIPVSYENQTIGKTNKKGHLLLPSVRSYYSAKYAIDPLSLPPDMDIKTVEQSIALRQSSGYLMKFPVKKSNAITVVLTDSKGQLLPPGSFVFLNNASNVTTYVGWDGLAYFDNVQANNKIKVIYPDQSKTCSVSFNETQLTQALQCVEERS